MSVVVSLAWAKHGTAGRARAAWRGAPLTKHSPLRPVAHDGSHLRDNRVMGDAAAGWPAPVADQAPHRRPWPKFQIGAIE
jgi:hypothetical protein